MLSQPSKVKFLEYHKLRTISGWKNKNSSLWEGFIYLTSRCKLTVKHFEIMRLRLLRILRLQKRLSTKASFKMKRSAKVAVHVSFQSVHSFFKNSSIFWFTGFPHIATTHDTKNSSMGKGKGHMSNWYFLGHEGTLIMRFMGLRPACMKYAMSQITKRLPGKPSGNIMCSYLLNGNFDLFTTWK